MTSPCIILNDARIFDPGAVAASNSTIKRDASTMADIEDEDEDEAEIGLREGMTLDDARKEIMAYAEKLEPREIRMLKSFYPRELHGLINQVAKQKRARQREYESNFEEAHTLDAILETKEQHGQLQAKIDGLTSELTEMHSKFDETSAQLNELTIKHETLESSAENDKATIESLKSQIAELLEKIDDLKKTVESNDNVIATKDEQLVDKDDIIKVKDNIIKSKEEELQNKSTQINDLDAEKNRIASQLDELAAQVAGKDALIDAVEGEKASLDATIADLQKELKEKEIRLQALDYNYFKKARQQKAEEVNSKLD